MASYCEGANRADGDPADDESADRGADAGGRYAGELLEELYGRLRDLASRYLGGGAHTLQPTALVHEAYLKCAAGRYRGREHFHAVAATAMRQVLVDHARGQRAKKRGGSRRTLYDLAEIGATPVDVVALDDALDELRQLDARKAAVVELRVFGGLTLAEAAAQLHVSTVTVSKDWRFARAWLATELFDVDPESEE